MPNLLKAFAKFINAAALTAAYVACYMYNASRQADETSSRLSSAHAREHQRKSARVVKSPTLVVGLVVGLAVVKRPKCESSRPTLVVGLFTTLLVGPLTYYSLSRSLTYYSDEEESVSLYSLLLSDQTSSLVSRAHARIAREYSSSIPQTCGRKLPTLGGGGACF